MILESLLQFSWRAEPEALEEETGDEKETKDEEVNEDEEEAAETEGKDEEDREALLLL